MSETTPMISLSADRTVIRPGECATIRWHVEGVKAVYFFEEGQRWHEHGVAGVAEKQVCPKQTTAYRLRVIQQDDSPVVRGIKIHVLALPQSETVHMLSVDRVEVEPGEPVTFRWHVEGVKAVYFYAEGQNWQDHGQAGVAERQVRPTQTTVYRLRVVKRDDSIEEHPITIEVVAPPPAARKLFAADRTQIRPGQCTTIRWYVPEAQAVYVYPEGRNWQEHGAYGEGERQVCPTVATTYCLRIVKLDGSTEIHYISIDVQG